MLSIPYIEEVSKMAQKKTGKGYGKAIEGLRAVAAWNNGGRQDAVDRLANMARTGRQRRR